MLVDLERRHLIDLLPNRSADSVAAWLATHPGVEIVSRDRGGLYAEGAARGAPQAQQVADRFHLVKNLGAALEHFLLHKRQRLKEVAVALAQEQAAQLHPQATVLTPTPPPLTPGEQRAEDVSLARHALRLATYERVVALRAKGVDIAIIADRVGISQRTVYRCLHLNGPPQRKRPTRYQTPLTPYLAYLLHRWDEGCHNAVRLWRELQAQGYPRGCASVERFIRLYLRRRTAQVDPTAVRAPTPPPVRVPTARHVAMLFVRQAGALKPEQQAYLTHLCHADPAIAASYALTQDFITMVHTRSGERLERWIATTVHSDCMELRRFARGLVQDYTAVQAGLTLEWNNGQVEGVRRVTQMCISPAGR
jgi:transposase